MTTSFEPVKRLVATVGKWDLSVPERPIYQGPQPGSDRPFGICVSDVTFVEGEARITVKMSKITTDAAGRFLIGYKGLFADYLMVGIGGHGYAYTLYEYKSGVGWPPIVLCGATDNLVADKPINISVHVKGQRLAFKVDDVLVFEHLLKSPIPLGQLGLLAWDVSVVEFTDFYVQQDHGSAFGARIFLCHAKENDVQVKELFSKLREQGFDPWYDKEKLDVGDRWEEEINAAIENADFFAICLSKAAVAKRGFVQKEIRTAIREFQRRSFDLAFLLPIRFEECEVPNIRIDENTTLQSIQWADLFPGDTAAFTRFINGVKKQWKRSKRNSTKRAQPSSRGEIDSQSRRTSELVHEYEQAASEVLGLFVSLAKKVSKTTQNDDEGLHIQESIGKAGLALHERGQELLLRPEIAISSASELRMAIAKVYEVMASLIKSQPKGGVIAPLAVAIGELREQRRNHMI